MSPSSSKTSAATRWKAVVAIVAVVALLCGGTRVRAESRRKASSDVCLSDPVCFGLYEEARRLSKAGDLAAAVVAYQAAYRRQSVPWLLINLGRTLHKLGRPQEALTYYERYSSAEPNGPPERQQMVREYTAQAEKALAEKSATDKPAAELLVDATAAPAQEPPPQPLTVAPLPVAVSTSPPTTPPSEGNKPAGDEEPPRKEGMPAYFWAGAGAGGALLAAGAITGGLTLSQSANLQATAFSDPPSEALLEQQTRIRTLAATTDALLVVGGVTLTAVTVAALVQRYRKRSKPSGPSSHAAVRPAAVTLGPGGLVGHF